MGWSAYWGTYWGGEGVMAIRRAYPPPRTFARSHGTANSFRRMRPLVRGWQGVDEERSEAYFGGRRCSREATQSARKSILSIAKGRQVSCLVAVTRGRKS